MNIYKGRIQQKLLIKLGKFLQGQEKRLFSKGRVFTFFYQGYITCVDKMKDFSNSHWDIHFKKCPVLISDKIS